MRNKIIAGLATVMMAVSAIVPAQAQGFGASASAIATAAPSTIDQVRHHRGYSRDRGYYRGRGYYNDRRYYRRDRGSAVAAGVAGLAVGALVGSAVANQNRYYAPAPVYAGGGDWHAYCASKYRSYDVRSGTYLGYDGYRHPCR